MGKPPPTIDYRRARSRSPGPEIPFARRWYGRLLQFLLDATFKTAILGLGVLLLSLAFAPFKQFYLAWVGLVPWLVIVSRARGVWGAFAWSWVGGVLFLSANMWWLASVTGPGLIALMIML